MEEEGASLLDLVNHIPVGGHVYIFTANTQVLATATAT
jgi:hypothetical protein